MEQLLNRIQRFVWGPGTLVLILGVGLVLTLRLRFVQLRRLPRALAQFFGGFGKSGTGTSPFRALCTALAATVGTGNLVGVAGAICLGGPGAVFWMWVSGFLGMATKYAEATLAVRYREKTPSGYTGGTMYMITRGMGEKFRPLAKIYCLFGLLASFGVGNATQISAMAASIGAVVPLSAAGRFALGVFLAVVIGALLLGGAGRIGAVAEGLVPVLSGTYILLCLGALMANAQRLPGAFAAIFNGAFSPEAVTAGVIGSRLTAMRVGCSRGTFTNEAGMGTAAMAHAAAEVDHPANQGLMGVVEVFLDTMVICTLTALVILTAPISMSYGRDAGMALTGAAFSTVYGAWAKVFLALATGCFAFATVLGWGLYGATCAEFLFGRDCWRIYALIQAAVVIPGACLEESSLWLLADIFNGLMALPNLLALAVLLPEVVALTRESDARLRRHPLRRWSILAPYKGGDEP